MSAKTAGNTIVLRVSNSTISFTNGDVTPGPSDDCYFIRINGVPKEMSTAQLMLLFSHTVKKIAERGDHYEFSFTDLCPLQMALVR